MIGIVSFTAMVKENLPDKAFAKAAGAYTFFYSQKREEKPR